MRALFVAAALAKLASGSSVSSFLGSAKNSVSAGAERLKRDDDGGYHYMPHEKVLICICAKCGSTSLYEFLYAETFGKPWNYTGIPYIHDVMSPRWEDKFEVLSSGQTAKVMEDDEAFKFALMRDPKVRLTSSWKSKVACDGTGNWGTDKKDRARMVPRLRDLAGMERAECLDFDSFVETLNVVHEKGLAANLNVHFRPQQHGCFREFEPSLWSKVAPISDPGAAHELAEQLGDSRVSDFPHQHSSHSDDIVISKKAEELLDKITKEEYEILARRPM